jgi:hypothetical protein
MTQPQQSAPDFLDAPPLEVPEWPPVGAYPGEPGFVPGLAADEPFDFDSPHGGRSDFNNHPRYDPDHEIVEGDLVWHQPPPSGPFHARHEKPGEWQTEPPEHLAMEHSPPAEVQPGVQYDHTSEAIPLSMLPHPWEVPFDPQHTETVVLDPPRRRRTALWVSLALVVALLFGGGTVSAYLLLRDADNGKGAPDPATAVNRFMTAIYTRQDARAAGDAVCREARDQQRLAERVGQVKGYANEYEAPSFRWNDPVVSAQTEKRATVGVQLTMTTDDEKTAQQQLSFTVIRKTGWLVCDVSG